MNFGVNPIKGPYKIVWHTKPKEKSLKDFKDMLNDKNEKENREEKEFIYEVLKRVGEHCKDHSEKDKEEILKFFAKDLPVEGADCAWSNALDYLSEPQRIKMAIRARVLYDMLPEHGSSYIMLSDIMLRYNDKMKQFIDVNDYEDFKKLFSAFKEKLTAI